MSARLRRSSIALALVVGMATSQPLGCSTCPPDPIDLLPGTYEVVEAPEDLEALVGTLATVEQGGVWGIVTLHYVDAAGNEWTVRY